jgi:hypothetical protein
MCFFFTGFPTSCGRLHHVNALNEEYAVLLSTMRRPPGDWGGGFEPRFLLRKLPGFEKTNAQELHRPAIIAGHSGTNRNSGCANSLASVA